MEGRSRQTLRSTADAIAKLRQASQTINRREGLQPSESKRVREALRITVQSGDVANSDAAEGDVYELFLRKVSNHAGPQMVVLCAVGLGRTVVKALKDRIRVDLPFAIKDQAATLESEVIQDLVEKILPEAQPETSPSKDFPVQHTEVDNPLNREEQDLEQMMATTVVHTYQGPNAALTASVLPTGYVCELTIEDAQAVTVSDQIRGQIWLTYPYNTSSMPFLTIPITPESARQYVETRPQIMYFNS